MPGVAVILWAIYFAVTVVFRVARHRRLTGTTGLTVMQAPLASVQWWAETAEVVALTLGVMAPVLALDGGLERIDALDATAVHVAGIVVFVAGMALTALSQEAMGRSWRIGVRTGDRTDLVTHGPFALVRNPIFTGVAVVMIGSVLLVPSILGLGGLALLVVSIEAQVRVVEEPYLLGVHGERYADYAARVGRFVPGVGRLGRGRDRRAPSDAG